MRHFVLWLILLLLLPITVICQSIDSLLLEARQIMSVLGIKERMNVVADGRKRIVVDNSYTNMNAAFRIDSSNGYLPNGNVDMRFYLTPTIFISKTIDSILTHKKDTTRLIRIKAMAIIVHEFVHYLQDEQPPEHYIKVVEMKDEKAHYSQKIEFEAYASGAYFFLQQYSQQDLKEIMESGWSVRRKMELLINKMRSYVYPFRDVLF